MPGRAYSANNDYRYGFNGQEKSTEIDAGGNSMTAEFWQYDARLGRRWNVDPVYKHSPYEGFGGNPIIYSDPNGLDSINFNQNITIVNRNSGQKPTVNSTFSISVVPMPGKDVFSFNRTISTTTGGVESVSSQTTILHPEDKNSQKGVTKGRNIYFDGLWTTDRDNKDWESVGKFMNLDKGFYDYMVARHPASPVWRSRALSIEVMEMLMPVLVQSGLGAWAGYRFGGILSATSGAANTGKGSVGFYQNLFKPVNEFDVTTTIYRGLTGSEVGATQIFMTNEATVAATYIKNGGCVMKYEMTQFSLKSLEASGELSFKTGIHGPTGMVSTEYMFQGSNLVKALNSIAKPK